MSNLVDVSKYLMVTDMMKFQGAPNNENCGKSKEIRSKEHFQNEPHGKWDFNLSI